MAVGRLGADVAEDQREPGRVQVRGDTAEPMVPSPITPIVGYGERWSAGNGSPLLLRS